MKRTITSLLMLVALGWSLLAVAAQNGVDHAGVKPDVAQTIIRHLTRALPGLRITVIQQIPDSPFYEVSSNNDQMIYATADGRHILVGELYSVSAKGVHNVTAAHMAAKRKALLAKVPASQMITFAPKGKPKAVVDVFTDLDCPYCRMMQSQIDQYTALGIQVNYLAFPRSGPDTPSFYKYVSVWCSKDPKKAFADAKMGKPIPRRNCPNPVLRQYELGNEVGVNGTPTIVLPDGHVIGGYVPAHQLAKGLGIL